MVTPPTEIGLLSARIGQLGKSATSLRAVAQKRGSTLDVAELVLSKPGLQPAEEGPRCQNLDSEGLLQFEQVGVGGDDALLQRSNRKPPPPRWHRGKPESLPGFPAAGQRLSARFTFGRQNEGFLLRPGNFV